MAARQSELTEKGLGSNVLKCIAMAAMLCDHASVVFLGTDMTPLRWIGRLAFPIYCFFVAVGADRTSSIPRYLRRLLIFALVSEIPFDLAFSGAVFDWSNFNVFFTLLGGLFCVWCVKLSDQNRRFLPLVFVAVPAVCFITEYMGTDYGAMGVIGILSFYLFRRAESKPLYIFGMFFSTFLIALNPQYIFEYSFTVFLRYPINQYELGALAAVPLMLLYTGKRGVQVNKYVFYAFYPAHLLLLWAIHLIISR